MTVFQWTTHAAGADDTGYVFGTELPKLVVNEVYLEYDNDPYDPHMIPNPNNPPVPPMINGATQSYHMNVWTELVNPLPATASQRRQRPQQRQSGERQRRGVPTGHHQAKQRTAERR